MRCVQRSCAAVSARLLLGTVSLSSLATSMRPSSTNTGHSHPSGTTAATTSTPQVASASSLPYPMIMQHFLHAFNDGNKDIMEPFLHHNFVYEQAPAPPFQPKASTVFKYDFLKRSADNRNAFSSRKTEVTQMVVQGNIVVVESKATAVLALDVPKLAKKGDRLDVFATTWFEFDPSTQTIIKMKGYECVASP